MKSKAPGCGLISTVISRIVLMCISSIIKHNPTMIPLSLILRKAMTAYEFSGSKEKINNLLFMDDLKLYSRSEKRLDSLVQTVCVFVKI